MTKINKFFPESDEPNLPNHDIRTVLPNGHMNLQFKDDVCFDFRPTLSSTKMSESSEVVSDQEDEYQCVFAHQPVTSVQCAKQKFVIFVLLMVKTMTESANYAFKFLK